MKDANQTQAEQVLDSVLELILEDKQVEAAKRLISVLNGAFERERFDFIETLLGYELTTELLAEHGGAVLGMG